MIRSRDRFKLQERQILMLQREIGHLIVKIYALEAKVEKLEREKMSA